MNKDDLSSDESDDDYVPEGADAVLPSEEESDGEPEDDMGTEEHTGKKRGKAKRKTKSKKVKLDLDAEPEPEEPVEETPKTEEEQKKKSDSLWADFLKDTNTKPKPAVKGVEGKSQEKLEPKPEKPPPKKEVKTVSVTKIFEFAGEEVRVTKEVPVNSVEAQARVSPLTSSRGRGRGRGGGGSGLSSVLSSLGKKEKISTLEKTKLDWDRFKKEEKIEEELQAHNKGKDGYLERQDFLQRADLRQFELEKEFRTKQRSHRI